MPFEGGRLTAGTETVAALAGPGLDLKGFARRHRWPLLLIVLPTLLAAIYYGLFAANQYVSEASFLVRNPQQGASTSILGQMMGGANAPPSEESSGVADYLTSHDAARALQAKLDIVSMYRRTGIDLPARIKARPTEEDLTKYLRRHVKVTLDHGTGIIKMQVRAFRPADSKRIADELLLMGEQTVNRFSERAEGDAIRVARAEVDRTQKRMLEVGGQLTQFRDSRQSLDPTSSSQMVMGVMGGLEAELAKARAAAASARAYMQPGSPRLQELDSRVSALSAQVGGQRARLTGSAGSLAPKVADYDRLMTEREFATRDYASAMTAYEAARVDAMKQHLYLVRVVEPNLAQKSLYPQRWLSILTVLVGLLVAYGIGWLILTGTREHAI